MFFDDLGWPWPKHRCLSNEASIKRVSQLHNVDHLRAIAEMVRRPPSMLLPDRGAAVIFSRQIVGTQVLGVVVTVEKQRLRLRHPRKVLPVLSLTVCRSKSKGIIRLYVPTGSAIRVGDVITAVPEERHAEHGRVLYAATPRMIKPPA